MRRNTPKIQSPFANFASQTAFLDFGLFLFAVSAGFIGLTYIHNQESDAPLASQQDQTTVFNISYSQPIGQMEIIVWVNQQGLVFINGKHVHIENLRYVLKQAQDETSSAGVYLVGHPDARFGTLAGIHKTLGQGNEQQSGLLASNHLYVTP